MSGCGATHPVEGGGFVRCRETDMHPRHVSPDGRLTWMTEADAVRAPAMIGDFEARMAIVLYECLVGRSAPGADIDRRTEAVGSWFRVMARDVSTWALGPAPEDRESGQCMACHAFYSGSGHEQSTSCAWAILRRAIHGGLAVAP